MSELVKTEHPAAVAAPERTRDITYTPRFDIGETEDELVLYGDLPGVSPQDLEIHFENKELTIHGKVAPRHSELECVYGEYGIGDFYRTFAIGESVAAEKISAELKNGVLIVHLPKTDAVKPRKIAVKAG